MSIEKVCDAMFGIGNALFVVGAFVNFENVAEDGGGGGKIIGDFE